MNERIHEMILKFAEIAEEYSYVEYAKKQTGYSREYFYNQKFAELIVQKCSDICMEMAAKCAGLPGDGALAKDCAYWIKKDFGVRE